MYDLHQNFSMFEWNDLMRASIDDNHSSAHKLPKEMDHYNANPNGLPLLTESQKHKQTQLFFIMKAGMMVSQLKQMNKDKLELCVSKNYCNLVNQAQFIPKIQDSLFKSTLGAKNTINPATIWRMFRELKALLKNQLIPYFEIKSGENENDAILRVRQKYFKHTQSEKKKREMAKKRKADEDEDEKNEDDNEVEDDEEEEILSEVMPDDFFVPQLYTMLMFKDDVALVPPKAAVSLVTVEEGMYYDSYYY